MDCSGYDAAVVRDIKTRRKRSKIKGVLRKRLGRLCLTRSFVFEKVDENLSNSGTEEGESNERYSICENKA